MWRAVQKYFALLSSGDRVAVGATILVIVLLLASPAVTWFFRRRR
jgi:hypothetical protein